jgi:hypothetical protein
VGRSARLLLFSIHVGRQSLGCVLKINEYFNVLFYSVTSSSCLSMQKTSYLSCMYIYLFHQIREE